MARPKNGPDGRNRWQGRGRMDLLCAYPAQPHVITKFHEGKLNSSFLCFSEKERENLVAERRKFHVLDWNWKQYVGDSCLRPWFVYGVVQTTLTPLVPQHLLRVTTSLKECQKCTFSLSGQAWWSLSLLQEQQDLRPGVTWWVWLSLVTIVQSCDSINSKRFTLTCDCVWKRC